MAPIAPRSPVDGHRPRRPGRPSAVAVADALAARPAGPRSLAGAIERDLYFRVEVPARFVEIVATAFPDDAAVQGAILDAGGPGCPDEAARVEAFLAAVDQWLFPVEDWFEEYDAVIRAIPFRPLGFEAEALEELSERPGYQALIALVAPDAPAAAPRSELLHGRCGVSPATLALLPREPPPLGLLHRRFAGGPHAAVVDMARWLRAETGTAFLDNTYETTEWHWWPWTAWHVAELVDQWASADALLDRVNALADWLEEDLPRRFRDLLLLAGRRDAGGRSRRAARRSRRRGRRRRAA